MYKYAQIKGKFQSSYAPDPSLQKFLVIKVVQVDEVYLGLEKELANVYFLFHTGTTDRHLHDFPWLLITFVRFLLIGFLLLAKPPSAIDILHQRQHRAPCLNVYERLRLDKKASLIWRHHHYW